ncbi:hypothetical protein [Sulfurovum sp.]|uniref:hypothetical protein n=1 Tax=Sulfurovum sp. TaxID=1969726 RepID=UPI0026002C2D|nr:hypothetical protein [Sulfurovum sp.]
MLSRNIKWLWGLVPLVLLLILLFSIEASRTFLLAVLLRMLFFAKKHIIVILSSFFLIKGKFILTLFLKKVTFLGATGLSKRYLIEKVITKNLKIHFLDHISNDIKRLVAYVKKNFSAFPLMKQIIAGVTFLGSLGFVGKLMGGMIVMKVFIARFWSLLLAIFLKLSTGVVYFFTDFLWGSWIAPLVEVLLFSWLLEWMEKVPFLKKILVQIYDFLLSLLGGLEGYAQKLFHRPLKHFFKHLVRKIKKSIYAFIGYERVSSWKRLQEIRALEPNSHTKLMKKREERNKKEKVYVSAREKLQQKRKKHLQ